MNVGSVSYLTFSLILKYIWYCFLYYIYVNKKEKRRKNAFQTSFNHFHLPFENEEKKNNVTWREMYISLISSISSNVLIYSNWYWSHSSVHYSSLFEQVSTFEKNFLNSEIEAKRLVKYCFSLFIIFGLIYLSLALSTTSNTNTLFERLNFQGGLLVSFGLRAGKQNNENVGRFKSLHHKFYDWKRISFMFSDGRLMEAGIPVTTTASSTTSTTKMISYTIYDVQMMEDEPQRTAASSSLSLSRCAYLVICVAVTICVGYRNWHTITNTHIWY